MDKQPDRTIRQEKAPAQVLIDVTLVEISESDVFDYDLQLVTKFPRFEPGGEMDKLPALLAPEGSGFPSNRVTELGAFVGGSLGGQGFYVRRHPYPGTVKPDAEKGIWPCSCEAKDSR